MTLINEPAPHSSHFSSARLSPLLSVCSALRYRIELDQVHGITTSGVSACLIGLLRWSHVRLACLLLADTTDFVYAHLRLVFCPLGVALCHRVNV